jgi:hypothetical protein
MKETQVTLSIPEEVYRHAKRLAQAKNRNVNELLAESIVLDDIALTQTADESDDAIDREEAAYIKMHPTLREKHFGEYVAIYQGQLVDYDTDGAALSRRMHRKFPNTFVWMSKVTEEPIQTIHVPSFRFLRDDE